MRMTASAARKFMAGQGKAKSKYKNAKTVVDGITFDSKAEAAYYENLKDNMRLGIVKYFLRQVPFHMPGGVKYICDFAVVSDAGIEYVDVKGMQTAVFLMKKKLVEALYPVRIVCLKRIKGNIFREVA